MAESRFSCVVNHDRDIVIGNDYYSFPLCRRLWFLDPVLPFSDVSKLVVIKKNTSRIYNTGILMIEFYSALGFISEHWEILHFHIKLLCGESPQDPWIYFWYQFVIRNVPYSEWRSTIFIVCLPQIDTSPGELWGTRFCYLSPERSSSLLLSLKFRLWCLSLTVISGFMVPTV